ncbi:MAG: STAS domain-containing protein [Pseudomonadota bacterium]
MVKSKNEEVMAHDPLMEIDQSAKPGSDPEYEGNEKQSVISQTANVGVAMENRVNLGENLTIQEVSEILASFRTAADISSAITLEASGLSRVDGAGVQLLCAIFKEAKNQHMDITWNGESDALNSAADQMGVTGDLRLSLNG